MFIISMLQKIKIKSSKKVFAFAEIKSILYARRKRKRTADGIFSACVNSKGKRHGIHLRNEFGQIGQNIVAERVCEPSQR